MSSMLGKVTSAGCRRRGKVNLHHGLLPMTACMVKNDFQQLATIRSATLDAEQSKSVDGQHQLYEKKSS